MAFMAAALPFISAGMTILGAVGQSSAQRQAGDIAYSNAVQRNQALEIQAQQREEVAKAEQASAQRAGLEQSRKGRVMASRAQAVMAASGANVDDKMIAGLLAEGEYGKDVAIYEGDEKARGHNTQATLDRYQGASGLWSAGNTRAAMNRRADMTLLSGFAGAGLSLAGKYGGGPAPGAPVSADATMDAWRAAPRSYSMPGLELT